jgi:hypothetical protein
LVRSNVRFVDLSSLVRCTTPTQGRVRFRHRALMSHTEHAAPARGRTWPHSEKLNLRITRRLPVQVQSMGLALVKTGYTHVLNHLLRSLIRRSRMRLVGSSGEGVEVCVGVRRRWR